MLRFVTTLTLTATLLATATAPAAEKSALPLAFEDDFEKGADAWQPTDAKACRSKARSLNMVAISVAGFGLTTMATVVLSLEARAICWATSSPSLLPDIWSSIEPSMRGARIIIAISASKPVASNADPRGRKASHARPSAQFLLLPFRIA